jgi:hypothetical protein
MSEWKMSRGLIQEIAVREGIRHGVGAIKVRE